MDSTTQALILGISGIMATLVSSSLGLYFTARARTAPLRNHLYSKQLDLVLQIILVIGRIRIYLPIILAPEPNEHREQALEDLRGKVSELSQLVDSAAALFPTELYAEINQLSHLIVNIMVDFDEGRDVAGFQEELGGHATKVALLARTYLGVDELSQESTALFVKRKDLQRVSNVRPQDIIQASKRSQK